MRNLFDKIMTVQRRVVTKDQYLSNTHEWKTVLKDVPCRVDLGSVESNIEGSRENVDYDYRIFCGVISIQTRDRVIIDGHTTRIGRFWNYGKWMIILAFEDEPN